MLKAILHIPICLIICCVLQPGITHAQKHVRKIKWYDAKKTNVHMVYYVQSQNTNMLDSSYTEYYQTGSIKSKGNYKNNKPTGTWYYYYENGKLKMTGDIQNFRNNGKWVYYYENGSKNMEGVLANGIKEGTWKYYYDNGNLKSTGGYKNGVVVNEWDYYYEDGTIKSKTIYKDGKGLYKEYYKSGLVKMEGLIIDGRSDSTWQYYHENGKLKAIGIERDGAKDGFWKFYHETGLLASEGLYLNGVPAGNWRYYYESGALSSEGKHTKGEKDGFWKLYYPTGEFKAESQFNMGEGPYKEYYENGKLKVTGYIRKGQNEGDWLYYYEDGSLEGKCNFEQGEGQFIGYYPNGNLKMEGTIKDGVKTGIWKLYKPKGNLAGYYKTFYEQDKQVFLPIEESIEIPKDTLVSSKPMLNASKNTSKYKRPSRIRYFRPKTNEYISTILSINPIAILTYMQLPFYAEYYKQERLGYVLAYTFYRNPFFRLESSIPVNYIAVKGHSLEIQQRFYHANSNLGSLYFGHSLRAKSLTYSAIQNDSSGNKSVFLKQTEKSLEYALLAGDRIFLGSPNKTGFTIDLFVGLGIGYRVLNRNWDVTNESYNSVFSILSQDKIYPAVKLGFSFGYVF